MSNVIIKHCLLTLGDEIPESLTIYNGILKLGFKITASGPLKIEGVSVTKQAFCELASLLITSQLPKESEDFVIIERSQDYYPKLDEDSHSLGDHSDLGKKEDVKGSADKSTDSLECYSRDSLPLSPITDEASLKVFQTVSQEPLNDVSKDVNEPDSLMKMDLNEPIIDVCPNSRKFASRHTSSQMQSTILQTLAQSLEMKRTQEEGSCTTTLDRHSSGQCAKDAIASNVPKPIFNEDHKFISTEYGKQVRQTEIESSTVRERQGTNAQVSQMESILKNFDKITNIQDPEKQHASVSLNINTANISPRKDNRIMEDAESCFNDRQVTGEKNLSIRKQDEKLKQLVKGNKSYRHSLNTQSHQTMHGNLASVHYRQEYTTRPLSRDEKEDAQYGFDIREESDNALNELSEEKPERPSLDHTEAEDNYIDICLKEERFYLALKYFDLTDKEQYIRIIDDADPITVQIDLKSSSGKEFERKINKVKFVTLPLEKVQGEWSQIKDQIERTWPKQILISDSKVLVVGEKDAVEDIKKQLVKVLGNQDKATNRSVKQNKAIPKEDMRIYEQSAVADVGGRDSPQEFVEMNTSAWSARQSSDVRSREPDSSSARLLAYSNDKRGDELRINQVVRGSEEMSSYYHGHYSEIEIAIRKLDITKMEMDAIVNAANRRLHHRGGVAQAISLVAGHRHDKECQDFILENGKLEVTGVFVSRGWQLPAEYVLHAVGPKWDAYEDKDLCAQDLKKTILRCLVQAAKLHASTLALPSISAAIFRVPPDICAKSYMEAVKHFDEWNRASKCSLRKIYFVDVSDSMVKHIRDCFMQNWDKPCSCSLEIKTADLSFMEQFYKPSSELLSRGRELGHSQHLQYGSTQIPTRNSRPFGISDSAGRSDMFSDSAGRSDMFEIKNICLKISQKQAMELGGDVVIVIGELFNKISGITNFQAQSQFRKHKGTLEQKKPFQLGHILKPDGSSQRLVCLIHLKYPDAKNLKDSFQHLEEAMKHTARISSKLTELVITSELLGWGTKEMKRGTENTKLIGHFSRELHQWLSEVVSKSSSCVPNLKSVTVSADKDCHMGIQKVFKSREDVNSVNQHASFNQNRHGMVQSSVGRQGNRDTDQKPHSMAIAAAGYQGNRAAGLENDPRPSCVFCGQHRTSLTTPCCSSPICTPCKGKHTRITCLFCKPSMITVDQPWGRMYVKLCGESADGYENVKSWKIEYIFPPVLQEVFPGMQYYRKIAYLPAIGDSYIVLLMLRIAFMRDLIFTFIPSSTTRTICKWQWNDIEHKTSLHGGRYGYPDPGYIQRVTRQLMGKVNLDYLTQQEQAELDRFNGLLESERRKNLY